MFETYRTLIATKEAAYRALCTGHITSDALAAYEAAKAQLNQFKAERGWA